MKQQQRQTVFHLLLALAVLFGQQVTAATSSSSSPLLQFGARCADGSTPVNSLQVRCDTTPQLHWAGRKCNNASHVCPSSYSCSAGGLCCKLADQSFAANRLCRLNDLPTGMKPAALVAGGSCRSDSDCAGGGISSSGIYAHKCCSGTCVRHVAYCHRVLSSYLLLQSTGQMPNQHRPMCKTDGSFTRVQTDQRYGISWCVNETTGIALRSGCCEAKSKPEICPVGQQVHSCPRDMCSMHVCEADPKAKCRVNPCGSGCTVEFVNSAGAIVNCSKGITGCALKRQNFFTNLARMHRWDQTLPEQQYHFFDSAGDSWPLLQQCERQLCIRYDASLIETASAAGGSHDKCPKYYNLGHRCKSTCNRNSDCNTGTRCCYTGCGRECVRPIAMQASTTCQATISSGHCTVTGCHRMCKMFGWDPKLGKCRPFWYLGAGGNDNRYKTWSECMYYMHECHTETLISLPWRPDCRGSKDTSFDRRQYVDNGFTWCADSSGRPTEGSLHAELIECNRDGSLLKDKVYFKYEQKYIAKCPGGKQPAWCHETKINTSCQMPGVLTFADACNNCKLVYVNEDGDRVSCRSAEQVCKAGSESCKSPQPRFAFDTASGKCRTAPQGTHSCHSNGSLSDHAAFSREEYCMHSCSAGVCGKAKQQPQLFPDLCVAPSCSKQGAKCVADECTGTERYIFLENGTEVTECRRSTQPLDLKALATCTSASTSVPTRPPSTSRSPPPSSRSPPPSSRSPPPSSQPPRTSSERPRTTPAPRPSRPLPTRSSSVTRPSQPATSSASTARVTTTPTTTVTGLCDVAALLADRPALCSSNGQYLPKQCNATYCYCVLVDSGATLPDVAAVPRGRADSLICPRRETIKLNLDLRFDGDFDRILPGPSDEAAFRKAAKDQLSRAASLASNNIIGVALSKGSIVVGLQMSKNQADKSVDLPAAAFELKSAAAKRTLVINFRGETLRASARQDYNENSGKGAGTGAITGTGASTGGGGGGGGGGIGGAVGGAVAGIAVIAVIVVVAFIMIRRRRQGNDTDTSQMYETMSNASSFKDGGANYANEVYAEPEERVDVYDNFETQVASTA